jgi:hypothetical protein
MRVATLAFVQGTAILHDLSADQKVVTDLFNSFVASLFVLCAHILPDRRNST